VEVTLNLGLRRNYESIKQNHFNFRKYKQNKPAYFMNDVVAFKAVKATDRTLKILIFFSAFASEMGRSVSNVV